MPANDPRLVALVLIDEPESNVYGGVVAAPAFRNIAQGALRHLAVAPRKTPAIPAPASGAEAGVRSARRSQVKSSAAEGEGAPDFVGLSLREVLEKAQSLNVRVRLHGSGYVVKQSPAAGDPWADDGVLVLSLQG